MVCCFVSFLRSILLNCFSFLFLSSLPLPLSSRRDDDDARQSYTPALSFLFLVVVSHSLSFGPIISLVFFVFCLLLVCWFVCFVLLFVVGFFHTSFSVGAAPLVYQSQRCCLPRSVFASRSNSAPTLSLSLLSRSLSSSPSLLPPPPLIVLSLFNLTSVQYYRGCLSVGCCVRMISDPDQNIPPRFFFGFSLSVSLSSPHRTTPLSLYTEPVCEIRL